MKDLFFCTVIALFHVVDQLNCKSIHGHQDPYQSLFMKVRQPFIIAILFAYTSAIFINFDTITEIFQYES